jgi:hypothetical protein
MTLGSMRPHGVRGLFVTYQHCGHERCPVGTLPLKAPPQFARSIRAEAIGTVRGVFREGPRIYENSGFFEKTHIQICVVNFSCIKGERRLKRQTASLP